MLNTDRGLDSLKVGELTYATDRLGATYAVIRTE